MDTLPLFQTLNSIAILSPGLRDRISELLVEEDFKKKTLILKQGQVAHRIYFIKKGFVRAYYDKGRDAFTNWFMGEEEIIISVYSFFSRRPSFEYIEALEDCTLQSLIGMSCRICIKPFRSLT